jgi:type VI secretion system protein ImpM
MPAGLFGKLPAKRDFVAASAPRRFLEIWEGWLQAGVATSRQMLGEAWLGAYNSAPIWRFWLGAGICGEAMLGAFMASIDGVGRSFPLTVFVGEGGELLAPPELEPNQKWCEAAETALLEALAPDADYESIAAQVAGLEPPVTQPYAASLSGIGHLPDGSVLVRGFGGDLAVALRAARRFGHRELFAGQTFWWTIGGENYPATALVAQGLPPPTRFAQMLTGAFDVSPEDGVGGE